MTEAERAARAAAEAEAAERARRARINELRGQLSSVESRISHFESILRRLTDARTSMNSYRNKLSSEVNTPVVTYLIHGISDWEGTTADEADSIHSEVKSAKINYALEVDKLCTDIGSGIDRANSVLQGLYCQRNSILGELRSLGA